MKTADFAATVPWTGIIGKPDFEPGYLFWDGLKFISMDEIQWPTIGGLEDRILHTRSLADENLFELIKAEEAFRDLVVGTLTDSLEVEILKRIETDAGLTASISVLTDVVDDPVTGLAATYATLVLVQDAVDDPETGLAATAALVASIQEAVNDPVTGLSAAWTTITAIQTQIDDPTDGLAALSASIVSVEEAIYDPTTGLEARLNTEIAARQSGDLDLEGQVDSEALARIAADGTITVSLDNEITARIAGDLDVSAEVTAEAVARAAADGSLAAEYVLSVATGGGGVNRIAGFRVTNLGGGGGSSEFIVQADKFGFVNTSGLGSVHPFIIDGGVVYITEAVIKDLTIGTMKIAHNAVTNSVSAFTAGTMGISPGTTWHTIQDLYIDSGGGSIFLLGSATTLDIGVLVGPSEVIAIGAMRILRNGSDLGYIGRLMIAVNDAPGVGTHHYELQFQAGSWSNDLSNRSLFALETKK